VTATKLEGNRLGRQGGSIRGPLFRQLKPGPGNSAEEVFADQRARLQGAMVELAVEGGNPKVAVRDLSRAAGVSTRAFYKHFENAEECFAFTCESLLRCALRRASASRRAGRGWEDGLCEGLRGLMQSVVEHAKGAHLVLVDSFAASPVVQERTRLAIGKLEQLLAEALDESPDRTAMPPRVVQGMVAGVMRVMRTSLLAGQEAELPEAVDELMAWMLALRDAYATGEEAGVPLADAERSGNLGEGGRFGAGIRNGVGDERERILAAVAKRAVSDGYQALTVPRIRAEAGVSRRSFDAQFASVEDCFLEAVEALVLTATGRAARRAAGAGSWEQGIHRAGGALCAEVARHPTLGQLGFVDILAPGRAGLHRRERLVGMAADRLRETAPPEHRHSELAAEASAAAAWQIMHAEVAAGRGREMPKVAPTVAQALAASVLGGAPKPARAEG
jgi:AcrR family transcriptional regulator